MSSILKALKKLEEEKAARSGNAADIAGAILKNGRRKGQKPAWMIPAGMLAIAVAAVLATYSVMGGFSARRQEGVPAPSSPYPGTQSVASPIVTPAPAPMEPVGRETLPPLVLPQTTKKGLSPRAAPPSAAVQTTAPRTPTVKEEPLPVAPSPQKPATTTEKSEEVPRPATVMPSLSVSGIAWQKDSASRLAVVNGTSVTQGATVGGARVEEIFPDRVRFSFENRTVEVPLGKTAGDNR